MSIFRREKKDDYFAQAMKIEQTPYGKNSVEKKRDRMVATYSEPVLPKVAKILFISMFVITVAVLAVEIANFTRYTDIYDIGKLFSNFTFSCLVFWGVYTVILVIVSLIGMKFQTNDYNKKKLEAGIIDQTSEEKQRSRQAVRRLNSVYLKYIVICAIGLLFWLLFFVIVRIIL